MNKSKPSHGVFKIAFIFALLILSACGTNNAETPTATLPVPTITKTPAPTSTVTPSPTATPIFEGFGLSTELVKSLKAHNGFESSLNEEADGQYTVTATILSSEGQPTTQSVYVIPGTLSEDLASKNKFGNTPTIQTLDGKKLYWVHEERGWFAVEISADINKPVFVPFDQREVVLRVVITEFSQPFSQAAVERWKTSPGLTMGFVYLMTSAKAGGTKFAYFENPSMFRPGLSTENAPVQVLDAWFSTSLQDGTTYQFHPTKWFDPTNPKSPDSDEWKIIFAASGQEIMGDEGNREKFDALLASATAGERLAVVPIIRIQPGFFDSTNGLITLFVAQPSLEKLFAVPGNKMDALPNPGHDENPYKYTFDYHFPNLSPENSGITVGISQDDPKYHGFFPQDIQTIIFPSMIILRY